jgi:predicted nucleotidyltransferase
MNDNPLEVVVDTQLPVREVDEQTYLEVLADCVRVMRNSGIPHAFMGGLASTIYGRERHTHDLDLFVRPEDAERTLEALAAAAYRTEKSNPDWIFKATKKGLLVDVIYMGTDGAVFDEEMQKHVRVVDFQGNRLPIVAPEDLMALKLAAFREDTARQWYDCLAVLEAQELDWDYLTRRAARRPHRVLALLIYAAGEGMSVPWPAIDRLLEVAHPG